MSLLCSCCLMSFLDYKQSKLETQVEELKLALEAKDERVRVILGELITLRRDAERAKKSAKFDRVAREGQTKKLGILEHSVRTLRHDLQTNNDHRYGDHVLIMKHPHQPNGCPPPHTKHHRACNFGCVALVPTREKLEAKTCALERAWQNERSLRLQVLACTGCTCRTVCAASRLPRDLGEESALGSCMLFIVYSFEVVVMFPLCYLTLTSFLGCTLSRRL